MHSHWKQIKKEWKQKIKSFSVSVFKVRVPVELNTKISCICKILVRVCIYCNQQVTALNSINLFALHYLLAFFLLWCETENKIHERFLRDILYVLSVSMRSSWLIKNSSIELSNVVVVCAVNGCKDAAMPIVDSWSLAIVQLKSVPP